MKRFPSSEGQWAEYAKINAETWMLDALKLNPSEVDWDLNENDYRHFSDDWPWNPALDGWDDFKCELDGSKECVHFYFSIDKFEKNAYLSLTLWFLLPRRGDSVKIRIKHVKESQLPEIYKWLSKADLRNQERFSKSTARYGGYGA